MKNEEKEKTIVSSAVYRQIYQIVENAETCRNAYYWTPQKSAGARRSNERRFRVPQVVWEENGDTYSAEFCYHESCQNVYAKGYYTKNGKKTTLMAIRNSLKRLIPHDIEEVDY